MLLQLEPPLEENISLQQTRLLASMQTTDKLQAYIYGSLRDKALASKTELLKATQPGLYLTLTAVWPLGFV